MRNDTHYSRVVGETRLFHRFPVDLPFPMPSAANRKPTSVSQRKLDVAPAVALEPQSLLTNIMAGLQWFVECHHHDRSRVFTINKRSYQTCLDCGHEIDYAWERMGSMQYDLSAREA